MDELDHLRAALKAAPPAADPAVKAAALARAMENFDALPTPAQENADQQRPRSDRPQGAGFLTGVREMLNQLTTRPALAATASVLAICVGLVTLEPSLWQRPAVPATGSEPTAAPAPEVKEESTNSAAAQTASAAKKLPEAEANKVTQSASSDAIASGQAVATGGEVALADTPLEVETGEADERNRAAGSADFAGSDNMVLYEATPAPAPEALSITEPSAPGIRSTPEPNTEAFANDTPNPVKITAEEPVSTFSIDVDTAAYAVVRSSVTNGYLPPPQAVRIEEMVNYFPYAYPTPETGGAPFRASVNLFQTPWNKDTQLLRIGLQGALPAVADRPPLDLVFLIDTSGSMEDANKLPLLIQSFRLMVNQLHAEDKVAIVTYAGSAGLVLEPTPASDRAAILGALDRLSSGGSTAGQEGLQRAYQVAEGMKADGRVGRIILATDGDFNVGIADPVELTDFIAKKRESGTYLSVLGFGRGNLDDATMQALAQNGNGTAAYIDTLSEAQKVLVDQLSGALVPIADDVKIQIEFNPAAVAEYRLIGYETRALAREDFNNDRVDAGEIGAGRQVTALYEIVPVGSPARLSDPLRYGETPAIAEGDPTELGFLKLRYKDPGAGQSKLIETPIPAAPAVPDEEARFAAAIAGMGQLLSEPKYLGQWGWADAIALASGAKGEDPFGYRAEAVQIMRLGESLSGR